MTHTDPQVLDATEYVDQPLSHEEKVQAISLMTGDLIFSSMNRFRGHLKAEMESIKPAQRGIKLQEDMIAKKEFNNRDTAKHLLQSAMAQDIMYVIWRESHYPSDKVLSAIGLERKFQNNCNPLTKNSLANAICDDTGRMDAAEVKSTKRRVDRICAAMEIFGLLEQTEVRKNLKPIEGTQQLHDIMIRAYGAVSEIMAKQLQAKKGESNG